MGLLEAKDAELLNSKGNVSNTIVSQIASQSSGKVIAVPFSSPSARGTGQNSGEGGRQAEHWLSFTLTVSPFDACNLYKFTR